MTEVEQRALDRLPPEARAMVATALGPYAHHVERNLAQIVVRLAVASVPEMGQPIPCAVCKEDTRNAPVSLLCAKDGEHGERDCLAVLVREREKAMRLVEDAATVFESMPKESNLGEWRWPVLARRFRAFISTPLQVGTANAPEGQCRAVAGFCIAHVQPVGICEIREKGHPYHRAYESIGSEKWTPCRCEHGLDHVAPSTPKEPEECGGPVKPKPPEGKR